MAAPWQARHGLTAEQFRADFDSRAAQGFRVLNVNGDSVNGVDRYASVWEQSPGSAWQARHGITSDAPNGLFDVLPG